MSGQKLSTLKPVVLANDDYDRSEETYEKEIYSAANFFDGEETPVKEIFTPASTFDCGQRYTSMQNIIISPRNCVNVTQDNVLDLFDEISRSDDVESHRQQYSALVQLYRNLPTDMFLSRILSDYNADEKLLYELRSYLFAELKSIEKCPFAPGTELKRRKNTTRGEGGSCKIMRWHLHTYICSWWCPIWWSERSDQHIQVFIAKWKWSVCSHWRKHAVSRKESATKQWLWFDNTS